MPARKIDHTKFVEMWNNNIPIKKIAETFNISEWTVHKYVDRHRDECLLRKGKVTKTPKIKHTKFIEMWNNNVPVEEIAAMFNVKFDTVCNYAGKHRSECPVRTFNSKNGKVDHAKFVEMWNNNISIKEISEYFAISLTYVSRYAKQYSDECPPRILQRKKSLNNNSEDTRLFSTIIIDTSAINNPKTFELIENAKKVIIFSTVLRELNTLKDNNHKEAKFAFKAREELRRVQTILRGCAFDEADKYEVVDVESLTNERNDETIARNAVSYKKAVVITCDYGLCCFCKLYKVKFLLLEPDVYKIEEVKQSIEETSIEIGIQNIRETCKILSPITSGSNYELSEVNGRLMIKCLYGIVEISRKKGTKFLNPSEKYQLLEGDQVTAKIKKPNHTHRTPYLVIREKGKLTLLEQ